MNDYRPQGFPKPEPPLKHAPPRAIAPLPPVSTHAIVGATVGIACALLWSTFLTVSYAQSENETFVEYFIRKPLTFILDSICVLTGWTILFLVIGGTIGAFVGVIRNSS